MSENFNLDSFKINENLVAVHLDAATSVDVITQLSKIFIEHGYVKPSYPAAVIAREETSPTGLPTPGVGTAIPHAETKHALMPGIAVGTLVKPVKWGQLGDPANLIDISIIFMLSVTVPNAQVYLLQSLIEVYKDEEMLRKLQATTDPAVIVEEVNAALEKVKAINGG